MSLFADTKKPLVGIDIGPSSIKVVELTRTSGRGAAGFRLERCASRAVPGGLMDGRRITQPKELGAALKEVLKAGRIKAKHAAIAVASSSVITKILPMPKGLSDRELEALVQLEADQYVPYALDEVKIDFEVLGISNTAPDSVDVLLAASHSENVDELVSAVRSAGLEPALVDVESFALQNACEVLAENWPGRSAQSAVAIVDIGSYATSVIVVQGGHVVYTRDQNIGSARLTEEIQARFGLDPAQAERSKTAGGLPEEYAQTVRRPFAEALAQEIRSALQFYYSAGAGEDVKKVYLAGGGALLPELASVLQESGVVTEVFNPFESIAIAPRLKSAGVTESAPAYAVACGLALRSFEA